VSALGNEAEDAAADMRARRDEPAPQGLEESTPAQSRFAELEKALAQFASRFENDDACRESAVEVTQSIDNAMSRVHALRQVLRDFHARAEEIFDAMEGEIERTAWKVVLENLELADRVEASERRVEEAKAYIAKLHDVHATT
jgi:crotonobetainyl-CoA:carnitine CoA-transferase CaiB-like acyl-CoA transferase